MKYIALPARDGVVCAKTRTPSGVPRWQEVDKRPRHPMVDALLSKLPGPKRAVAERLRELLHEAAPTAQEGVYYNTPFLFLREPLCYLSPARSHLTLGFPKGTRIADSAGFLTSTHRSEVAKVALPWDEPLPEAAIRGWVRQAARLDADAEPPATAP